MNALHHKSLRMGHYARNAANSVEKYAEIDLLPTREKCPIRWE
jgi:hypothetical protein